MQELVNKLNYYTKLYDEGHPEISDKDWDDLYFKLKEMEEKTGIVLSNSPTIKIDYQVISSLKKIEHNHPMLSLDKTKDINDIVNFGKNYDLICMAKIDGLTCSLRYINGKIVSAETRGNGIIGENITHNITSVLNVPLTLPTTNEVIIDGEIICTYENFKEFENEYANPRNFAAGSIRLLDSQECAKRKLSFIAWDCIKGLHNDLELSTKFYHMSQDWKFEVAPWITITPEIIKEDKVKHIIYLIKDMAKEEQIPIDGIVFKYDKIEKYNEMGRTDHHFKGGLAYKFYDETYPTHLRFIDWTMGRTGVLTPVAVFDPIEIDGATVERASLHNVSIMKELLGEYAYRGELLNIFKANQIIPQVASAEKKDNNDSTLNIIETCPICGGDVELVTSEDGVINAYCSNPLCEGKLINRLDHFCGKKGLDIKGLSKATFQKLIDWGWVGNIEEVFSLCNFRDEWIKKPGFGVASVDKILKSIEEHKTTTLEAFISAIGIPLIGRTAAKELVKHFKTYQDFRKAVDNHLYHFFEIGGFGSEMNISIKNFNYAEADMISKILIFKEPVVNSEKINNKLEGKTIVITGKLKEFKNRNELKEIILQYGGKVSDSISGKTDILINNDVNSTSSKNKSAKERGIPIISELDFLHHYIEK